MNIKDLKVGQKVLVNGNGYTEQKFYHPIIQNQIGTIMEIDNEHTPHIGIRFERENRSFRDCNGLCTYGYGWYVNPENIVKILEERPGVKTEISSDISKVTFDVSLEVLKKEYIKTLSEKHKIANELIHLNVTL